ncbi:hypothetical protein R1sor_009731 [Riccia sorocarpa]|uniref:DUF4283 domain-containing protein n=1 Tax=Riccia sorocarpa TaxID=122646 RepID=A0ABD3HVY2_9MARC
MVLNHTRASFDKTRGDDFSSPLKKKVISPEVWQKAKSADMVKFGGGTTLRDGGALFGGSNSTHTGLGNVIFSNPCYQQAPSTNATSTHTADGTAQGTQGKQTKTDAHHAEYLEEFPPLCKLIKAVDRGFFASRLRHLQNCAFVLCALDGAPSKDKIIEWAREELWQNRGIQVEQIRILARGCYLIVTESSEQQHKALMDCPYKLNGRLVLAFPWDPKFSPRELRTKLVPMWVDLPKVYPLLEAYGAAMLATLGKVLYKTCETGRDSHIHIRRCVLTDISRKLKDHVKMKLEEVEDPMIQPVWYTSLPKEAIANVDANRGISSPKQGEQSEEAQDEDGFTLVKPMRNGPGHTGNKIISIDGDETENLAQKEALTEEDEEMDEETLQGDLQSVTPNGLTVQVSSTGSASEPQGNLDKGESFKGGNETNLPGGEGQQLKVGERGKSKAEPAENQEHLHKEGSEEAE